MMNIGCYRDKLGVSHGDGLIVLHNHRTEIMIGIIKIFGFGLFIWSTDTDIEKGASAGTLSMSVFGNCGNYLLSSWKERSHIMKKFS